MDTLIAKPLLSASIVFSAVKASNSNLKQNKPVYIEISAMRLVILVRISWLVLMLAQLQQQNVQSWMK